MEGRGGRKGKASEMVATAPQDSPPAPVSQQQNALPQTLMITKYAP